MKILNVYTDGSYHSHHKLGAYAFVVTHKNDRILYDHVRVVPKGDKRFPNGKVTNNTMEMVAVIRALNWLKSSGYKPKDHRIYVYTDSQYIQLGLTEWIEGWKRKNWRNSDRKQVKNIELWKQLDQLWSFDFPYLHLQWVKGHAGIPMNVHVDKMCTKAIREYVAGGDDKEFENYMNEFVDNILEEKKNE